jgi:hypothetical protein
MKAERQSLARNMSAPPRTTLNFSALAPEAGATGDAISDGAGLAFVCRLDTGRLLRKRRQLPRKRDGGWEALRPDDRIRLAYTYARADADGRKRARSETRDHAAATPVETLADELRDLAAAVPLAEAGVPSFGLLLPTHGIERRVESSLVRTIAILARRRGTVFLREADPIVWSAIDGEVLDLWVPAAVRRNAA